MASDPKTPETQKTSPNSPDIKKELSDSTGIPLEQITPEMLEKYELAKSINKNLDLLEVKSEQDIAQKITRLNVILEKNDSPEEVSAALKSAATDVAKTATTEVKGVIEDTPEAVADWAALKASEKVQEKLSGLPFGMWDKLTGISSKIWEVIKQLFVALSGAFWGIGFTSWLKTKFGWGENETPTESVAAPIEATKAKSEATKWGDGNIWETIWEEQDTLQDFEKNQNTYATIWNIFFLQVAWESYETGNSKKAMLDSIQNKPWKELQNVYASFLEKNKNWESDAILWLYTQLWLDKDDYSHTYDDKALVSIMNSIVGPIPVSLITQRVSLDSINSLIESWRLESKLWKEFVNKIKWKSSEELSFKEISIIYTFLFPGIITEKFKNGKNIISDFLFWEEDVAALESIKNEFQERRNNIVSDEAVKEILLNASWTMYIWSDDNFRKLLKDKVSEKEIEALIRFKTAFLSNLTDNQKYNLWYTGFKTKLDDRVEYKDILSIYVLLNWNPNLENLPELESVSIYMWIVWVLWEDREYVSKLVIEVTKETWSMLSSVEKEILYKNLSRLSKGIADIFFENYELVSWWVRASVSEIAKSELWVDISQWEMDAVEWWIILSIVGSGGAIMYVPHPFVKMIGASVMLFGGGYAFSKLYDYGSFWKLEQYYRGTEVYDLMNGILEETYGKSISELAQSKTDWVPADEIFY